MRTQKTKGFSMIELLLVVAVIGIISAIAIPSLVGQRRRSMVIGDAMANAKVLWMQLESRKTDLGGIYGTAGTYTYTHAGVRPAAAVDPAPQFIPKDNSQMDYELEILASTRAYTLKVKDPKLAGKIMYMTNQNGDELKRYDTRKDAVGGGF